MLHLLCLKKSHISAPPHKKLDFLKIFLLGIIYLSRLSLHLSEENVCDEVNEAGVAEG